MSDAVGSSPDDHEAAEKVKEELRQAMQGSHEVLITAKTVFPFTLFPDTITVDRTKLTIQRKSFFRTADVMSIRIEDVLNVSANTGPMFGTLQITNRIANQGHPYQITHLWRSDALKVKRIMQGYVIAMQREIDCTPLSTQDLRKLLNQLGKDDH